jgi:hypothetical protein
LDQWCESPSNQVGILELKVRGRGTGTLSRSIYILKNSQSIEAGTMNLSPCPCDHNTFYIRDYSDVLKEIAIAQPLAYLNSFVIRNNSRQGERIFSSSLYQIDINTIIEWCNEKPKERYPNLACLIIPFKQNGVIGKLEWTSLACKVISNFDDPVLILKRFSTCFKPMSWSGSLADILQQRLSLISSLKREKNKAVVEWAKNLEIEMNKEIVSTRLWESKLERDKNERFE